MCENPGGPWPSPAPLADAHGSVGAIIKAEPTLSMAPTEDQNVCNSLTIITTLAVILLLKYSRTPIIQTPIIRNACYPNTTLTKVIRSITILTTLANLKQRK